MNATSTSSLTVTRNTTGNRRYKNPANVATLYRYRFTILDFDGTRYDEIQKWCKENYLCKVEILVVQTSNKQWACICAFEKKIECVGFKLWW